MTDADENFVLNVRPLRDMEALFGLPDGTSSSCWAVIDGALWCYCLESKTRWDTGWRRTEPVAFRNGFPQGVESFQVIERTPVAIPRARS